jgi:hydroxymethylglutaryl-CoA reductase (NADPH)
MTRSILIETELNIEALQVKKYIIENNDVLSNIVEKTSNYCKYIDSNIEIVGNLIYIRLKFFTDQASGHNMTTKAAQSIQKHLLDKFKFAKYVTISGNTCIDKKASAINGILDRGKKVTAEVIIPRRICEKMLRTTPENITALNVKKNYIGSILAGSIRSANAHFSNILLATYLATGQDAANIVEGSQGITYTNVTENGDLYFSVYLPNLIVGTVGNGKHLDFVNINLERMKCSNNSEKLAGIIAAATLCSELSLLAAQTNVGELMKAHEIHERTRK